MRLNGIFSATENPVSHAVTPVHVAKSDEPDLLAPRMPIVHSGIAYAAGR
jgi:hypothetical protein